MTDPFESDFVRLQSIDGLGGVCAMRGAMVVANHLPLSDLKTREMLSVIAELVDGYLEVGREMKRLAFGYDKGVILIACRGERRLVALADETAELERIMGAMEGFLECHLEFTVKRPRRKKKAEEDLDKPPLELRDEWGRKSISLQGLRASTEEEGGERHKPIPPPTPPSGTNRISL